MTAVTSAAQSVADALRTALVETALPGEIDGFTSADQNEAATFIGKVAAVRPLGGPSIQLESTGGEAGRRRMRLAVVNDDMPFLVDSVAAAVAAHGLTIHRLLHPIVKVSRDRTGELLSLGSGEPESIIYLELDRADARGRQSLSNAIASALADVRAAVRDWRTMRSGLIEDAKTIGTADQEAATFLHWLADDHFTLLGQAELDRSGQLREPHGILASGSAELWTGPADGEAKGDLASDPQLLLLLKAHRLSTVHRRAPLDVVRVRGTDNRISLYVGLWTSAALRAPPEEVPILRQCLEEFHRELGFAPSSHAAKALNHALSILPHDLLLSIGRADIKLAALTAMSLADRPQPRVILLPGSMRRNLFALVWIPSEAVSTARRKTVQALLEREVGAPVTSWSGETGDLDLGFFRFTQPISSNTVLPDPAKLEAELRQLVGGWSPAVEEQLGRLVGVGRATRLALSTLPSFPEDYRSRTPASEAAADIVRLARLEGERRRDVRLVRREEDGPGRLRLKFYRRGPQISLSEAVPALENFGFRVIEEISTRLVSPDQVSIHEFLIELAAVDLTAVLERDREIERALLSVADGSSENDPFNQLILFAGLEPRPVVWLRAWFRYLRQTGVAYGMSTFVEALRKAPAATNALIDHFTAAHQPDISNRPNRIAECRQRFDEALTHVTGIDDDRILRLLRAVVDATLRTNAFAPDGREAHAFKIDSSLIPGLPRPIPWREIWVYSPRVEGIHLRGGPIARGGIRWSDRRDDFRTEILGLMKAQLVKNAVIVPTGAKGGFYPKQLPSSSNREAWLAEGTGSYAVFIRSLLSVTDNIVGDQVEHPPGIVIHDQDDPYLVVAADKGTASFSDLANGIATTNYFWLGDAFASGGSNGYDHKAMGITARGAWISVQRHFNEMGIDVQSQPITVAGCGDMSGDVFGNGMLRSKAIKLVAAFDHRHIFIDPDPDPELSFAERKRLFELPRSSWADYDQATLSPGGGIFPRSEKSIPLSAEVRALLGIVEDQLDPASLVRMILTSSVDLLWFGGIGTFVKGSSQVNSSIGDPMNDSLRVDAAELRVKVIGEGANLAVTQAARIEFASRGGRINTDFIDNSAGVDCSDKEVNIKIALNREMGEERLGLDDRNALLAAMTDEVAKLVLEDNRLQALAISIAERGGGRALPNHVRTLELLEVAGRLDRRVEGMDSSRDLLRRGPENRGLTRPEIAVMLSLSKLALQDAAEQLQLDEERILDRELLAAFPSQMQQSHADAIRSHRLRRQILATTVANRLVNRLGPSIAFELTEEEACSLPRVVTAFLVAEQLLDLPAIWTAIDEAAMSEDARIELFDAAALSVRGHISDILAASAGSTMSIGQLCSMFEPGLDAISAMAGQLIRTEVREEADSRRERFTALGASEDLVNALVRLYELDGVFGLAALASRTNSSAPELTRAYTRLGEALGLDWAQRQLSRFEPADQWERLLTAGLARDFEQVRIDFLDRFDPGTLNSELDRWIADHDQPIAQFRQTIQSSRTAPVVTAAMLAHITNQARLLLARGH